MIVDNETLKYYQSYYFANETPVPFKVKDNNYTIYIRPIKVQMFPFYQDNVGILLIDRTKISDAKIISMSYFSKCYLLQYLLLLQEFEVSR